MMMKSYRAAHGSGTRPGPSAACSAVTVVAFGLIYLSTGPVRLIAVLLLLGAFVGAIWLLYLAQFTALGPAVGLALAGLILTGLALAAAGALTIDVIASAISAITLAIAWASTAWANTLWASTHHPAAAEGRTPLKRPSPFAVGGAVIFAAAAACSVHYSAASATADSDQASSLALWAYPAGDRLDVGVWEPAGYGSTSLRIVVTQAGVTIAAWKNIHLAPGQTWEAPPIALRNDGPTQVVAFRGGSVVASLSG
jgi:hypothetical protein